MDEFRRGVTFDACCHVCARPSIKSMLYKLPASASRGDSFQDGSVAGSARTTNSIGAVNTFNNYNLTNLVLPILLVLPTLLLVLLLLIQLLASL